MQPFTRSTEYAIRALTYLAINHESGRYHLAREMSDILGIPAPFLGKILQPLVTRNILESQRGRNGGFRLCKDPTEVTLQQISESQEATPEQRQCFLGQAVCSDERACPMHDYWQKTSEEFDSNMSQTTLQQLVQFCDEKPDSGYPSPSYSNEGQETNSLDLIPSQPKETSLPPGKPDESAGSVGN